MARKRSRRKPIPEGVYKAVIESLASDARGVARIDGKATFIEGALPGETVEFQYTKCKSKYDEGVVAKIISSADNRAVEKCPHAIVCGGCSLQHLDADSQIAMKQEAMLNNLSQIGNVTPAEILQPIRGDVWGYRRKARLGVRDVPAKGRVLVGFREARNRYLAEIESCVVLHPSVGENLLVLSDLIGSLDARGDIAQIEVAVSDNGTALVFRNLTELSLADQEKLIHYGKQKQQFIYLQPEGAESITPIWPEAPRLFYQLKHYDVTLDFLPSDFTQVNASINEKMVRQAIELMQIQPDDHVLDLFCGLGNFTSALARLASQVTGVEGDTGLVDRARKNAKANGIENISYHVANLFEDVKAHHWAQSKYDKLLLDPPRSGAQEVVENIDRISPSRIVYVSCHPATLARDAGILKDRGYTCTYAGVIDMFPHTMHVESMAVFERVHHA